MIQNRFVRIKQLTDPYENSDPDRLNNADISRPITEQELKKSLSKTKNTAPGPSKIRKVHIQKLPENAKLLLLDIFNASLSMGYFPDKFKISNIIMIPKKYPALTPKDYRPISLLEVIGKVFERILNARLLIYLQLNNKFHPNQFGFVPGRSAEMALAILTELIAQHKAQGHQISLVQRDISHAFDTVWHEGLKYKFYQLELPSPFLRIICNFLTNRKGYISHGGIKGPVFDIKAGVPQGSVQGPTFYILYTNKTPKDFHYSYNILFADDVSQLVFTPYNNLNHLSQNLNFATEEVLEYERKWKLKTSVEKFKTIPLGNVKRKPYFIDEKIQHHVNKGKTLGLQISTSGYAAHVQDISNRASAALGTIFRFRNGSEELKRLLYTTLVRPILEYPIVPLHSISRSQMYKLQKVQNKAVRFITNSNMTLRNRTEVLHKKAKIEPLNTRIHRRTAKLWNKIQDSNIPLYENHIKYFNYPRRKPKMNFPFSVPIATSPSPPPIYVMK